MLERFSIRWRLALISAGLTFLILCAFSIVIGQLTAGRIRADFRSETANAATTLRDRLSVTIGANQPVVDPPLELYAAPNNAVIRLFNSFKQPLAQGSTRRAPDLGPPIETGSSEHKGYRVETRFRVLSFNNGASAAVWLEYARPLRDLERTIHRLRLFLTFGTLAGTLLALVGGLALAKRSLRPVTALTAAARDITRTGDPGVRVPQSKSDDEVAELARTFDEMLAALESSRVETQSALDRQREFVADASHELRTPLTSVLANLELLAEELQGEPRETADAALRSSRRMRHLVADLLLLARSDAGRELSLRAVDLSRVAREAVGEASAIAAGHTLIVDARDGAVVSGARDELHRLTLNLVENAASHTPEGTQVWVRVRPLDDDVQLIVEDDGPGVPRELRERVFERFVRAGGDRRGSSTGLGLAIVQAVARAHGGDVALEDADPGARFVVTLPRIHAEADPETDDLGAPLASAAPAGPSSRLPGVIARRFSARATRES